MPYPLASKSRLASPANLAALTIMFGALIFNLFRSDLLRRLGVAVEESYLERLGPGALALYMALLLVFAVALLPYLNRAYRGRKFRTWRSEVLEILWLIFGRLILWLLILFLLLPGLVLGLGYLSTLGTGQVDFSFRFFLVFSLVASLGLAAYILNTFGSYFGRLDRPHRYPRPLHQRLGSVGLILMFVMSLPLIMLWLLLFVILAFAAFYQLAMRGTLGGGEEVLVVAFMACLFFFKYLFEWLVRFNPPVWVWKQTRRHRWFTPLGFALVLLLPYLNLVGYYLFFLILKVWSGLDLGHLTTTALENMDAIRQATVFIIFSCQLALLMDYLYARRLFAREMETLRQLAKEGVMVDELVAWLSRSYRFLRDGGMDDYDGGGYRNLAEAMDEKHFLAVNSPLVFSALNGVPRHLRPQQREYLLALEERRHYRKALLFKGHSRSTFATLVITTRRVLLYHERYRGRLWLFQGLAELRERRRRSLAKVIEIDPKLFRKVKLVQQWWSWQVKLPETLPWISISREDFARLVQPHLKLLHHLAG